MAPNAPLAVADGHLVVPGGSGRLRWRRRQRGTGPGGGGDLAGTYQLVGANDAAVPAVVTSPVCSPAQILSGSMELTAGGRWEMRFDWRDDNGRQWTGDHGSYRREGDNLLLTSEAWGDRFEGEVDGEDLDLAWSR